MHVHLQEAQQIQEVQQGQPHHVLPIDRYIQKLDVLHTKWW